MTITAAIIFIIYLLAFSKFLRDLADHFIHISVQELMTWESMYQNKRSVKDALHKRRLDLENQTAEIFALYEMTKDITQTLNEENAFKIFEHKLKDHVRFSKCRLLDGNSPEYKVLKDDPHHFIFILQWKKSKLGYVDIEGMPVEDKEKAMILAQQFALALRRVRLYEEVEQVAITDSLTGLSTRRYLMERLTEDLKRSKSRNMNTSILMIDVDYFKKFNDKYGHLVGDSILRSVAELIKANVRQIDIASRYGGEEFCIVLPDTDKSGATYVAERIRMSVEKAEIKAYDNIVNVTLSIGLSTFPVDAKGVSELIDKADWALYRAKKDGRNRVCPFGVYTEDV